MAAGPAVAAAIVPGKVVNQLTKETKREKTKSSHQAIEKAPQIDHVPIVRVEMDVCNLAEISETVVHKAFVLASITPTELVYDEGTIVENTEVAGTVFVWALGTQSRVAEVEFTIHR